MSQHGIALQSLSRVGHSPRPTSNEQRDGVPQIGRNTVQVAGGKGCTVVDLGRWGERMGQVGVVTKRGGGFFDTGSGPDSGWKRRPIGVRWHLMPCDSVANHPRRGMAKSVLPKTRQLISQSDR